MSAKHPKRGASKPGPPSAPPAAVLAPAPAAAGPGGAPSEAAAAPPSWLDSADPRKRLWGKIIFVAIWIYVGALWLLALDQTFNWGLFGPKAPPFP